MAAIALIVTIAAPVDAPANVLTEGNENPVRAVMLPVELLCPDVRWEVDANSGDSAIVLSWPLAFLVGWWELGARVDSGEGEGRLRGRYFFTFQPFIEPQWKPRDDQDFRLVAGARTTFGKFSSRHYLAIEYGAAFGNNQAGAGEAGGMVGLGVLTYLDLQRDLITIGPVARAVFTSEGTRFDFVIDVQVPIKVLF